MVLTDRIGGRLVIESQRVFDRIFCEAERTRARLYLVEYACVAGDTGVMAGILENSLKFSKPREINFVAQVHNTQYHLLILYLSRNS